jgi:serine/threonine protein kinase
MTNTEEWAKRFDAVLADYLSQIDAGQAPDRQAFLAAHPDLADDLAGYFEVQDRMQRLAHTDHGARPTFGGRGSPSHPMLQMANEPLPPGSLLGQYRLEELIGEGGMGRIYRATHLHLDRTLAIKVLAPQLARDRQLVARFQREARALAQLDHPNIVAVHDMGSQGDMHYFVMEYVPGQNLRQLMAAGALAPDRALGIVGQVCDALHFAHDRGIVHRDIKPENILIDSDGLPRVADFGLAKVLQEGVTPPDLTGTNVVLGTYNYMAPEQKRSARVDHRADIYAVGVVLYELLTGKLPAGHFAPPSSQAAVGAAVDALVLKALHSEPELRYQSAEDLGSDITTARVGGPTPTTDAAGRRTPPPDTRSLTVVESKTDQLLGRHDAAWVRVVLDDDETLEIRTWPRTEVGVTTDGSRKRLKLATIPGDAGSWLGSALDGLPGLLITLPHDDATLHVPEGLPVRVSGGEVNVVASGLRSALRIEPGSGKVKIRDHRGPLEIDRVQGGSMMVAGLSSEDFRLTTRKGRIVMTGLRFRDGLGHVHSDDGAIQIGTVDEECSFRFTARTLSGTLTSDLEADSPAPGATQMTGRLGLGTGQLDIDSFGGDVHLGDNQGVVWMFDLSESGRQLGWAALWIAGSFIMGWESLGWIMIWCWGIWALWEFIEQALPHRVWSRSFVLGRAGRHLGRRQRRKSEHPSGSDKPRS